jgi:hypothetical protein
VAQQKKKARQGRRKRAVEAPSDNAKKRGSKREISVDLGPIEPEVADVLALIDDAKGRPVKERAIEPENERGKGGAAAKRGRGGRRNERTPEQPGLSKKDRATKQL